MVIVLSGLSRISRTAAGLTLLIAASKS
jgi:hypothetical protein